ncbi:MAG: DUF433 domain-containing protein [Planctomycetes bacterium]|nr:DUF433 domain-containing protein [Planctomycetota bacterium]
MTLSIEADPAPLRTDEYGVIRVGNSQVLLDVVIREFKNGASPDGIVAGYPSLKLEDVYGVIAYYLRHQSEIDEYLSTRREEAAKLRQEIETKQGSQAELREKLMERKRQMEQEHAAAHQ